MLIGYFVLLLFLCIGMIEASKVKYSASYLVGCSGLLFLGVGYCIERCGIRDCWQPSSIRLPAPRTSEYSKQGAPCQNSGHR